MHARWLYLKSIEYKSTYDAPYRNLGSFYMKIGIRDKAINFMKEALKRAPGDETTCRISSSIWRRILVPNRRVCYRYTLLNYEKPDAKTLRKLWFFEPTCQVLW